MTDADFNSLVVATGGVSRETAEILAQFAGQLMRWNRRINLVAESTLTDLWSRHIVDSAQVVRFCHDEKCFVDLGSGAGFPAIVLAILFRDVSGFSIDLVESNRKKAGFLADTAARFSLPARVHAVRIEDSAERIASAEIVTARALAPLPKLLDLASPWLRGGAKALFHKGRNFEREIAESRDRWAFDLVEHPSLVGGDSAILEISGLTPAQ